MHIFEILLFFFSSQLYWIILGFVNRFVPVPRRYLTYTYMWKNEGGGVNLAWIYLIGITLFIAIMNLKICNSDITVFEYNVVLLAISLFPLGVQAPNAGRIEYYVMYLFVFIIPKAKYSLKRFKIGQDRSIGVLFIILMNVIYWLGTVGINDYTGTMPYIFGF